jgi:hypothetical protein
MYQHYVQKAFLDRWKRGEKLYIFDKFFHPPRPSPRRSVKREFGSVDWQSSAMEKAFSDVESCVGHTNHSGEITDPKQVGMFMSWMALHLVRNAFNFEKIAGENYDTTVDSVKKRLLNYNVFWQEFECDALITGDNPVVCMNTKTESFFIAPLNPRRCVYLVQGDRLPKEGSALCLHPLTINRIVFNTATRYCLSFDERLHLP